MNLRFELTQLELERAVKQYVETQYPEFKVKDPITFENNVAKGKMEQVVCHPRAVI
jgi:hypothetical protein